MIWLYIFVMSMVLLPADLVLACVFPDRIAPWIFVTLAFGFPALGVGMTLSRIPS